MGLRPGWVPQAHLAHSVLRCGSESRCPVRPLAAAADSTPRSHSVHLRTRPSSTTSTSSSYSSSSYLCFSLSSDTLSTGRRLEGCGLGIVACRPPGSSEARGGRLLTATARGASGTLVGPPLRRVEDLVLGQGTRGRRGSAEGAVKGLRGRASNCFSRWRLWMTRMASGVRLKEKRVASSGPAPAPGEVPEAVDAAGMWLQATLRGAEHVAEVPPRPGEGWDGRREDVGGCGVPGPRPGPRRAGGLFRVAEGQELESSISGGLLFFSPAAAAGGEGTGGAQGLRDSWRAAGPPWIRVGGGGGGGGGGIGENDMTLPSKRSISVLEGKGRVSVTARGAAPLARRPPAPPHLLLIAARARSPNTHLRAASASPSPSQSLQTKASPAAPSPRQPRELPPFAPRARSCGHHQQPSHCWRIWMSVARFAPPRRAGLGWAAGGGARAGKGLPSLGLLEAAAIADLLNAGDKVPDICRGGSSHSVPQGSALWFSHGS